MMFQVTPSLTVVLVINAPERFKRCFLSTIEVCRITGVVLSLLSFFHTSAPYMRLDVTMGILLRPLI